MSAAFGEATAHRNQPKSLSGIETKVVLTIAAHLGDRNQPKSLSGIETFVLVPNVGAHMV